MPEVKWFLRPRFFVVTETLCTGRFLLLNRGPTKTTPRNCCIFASASREPNLRCRATLCAGFAGNHQPSAFWDRSASVPDPSRFYEPDDLSTVARFSTTVEFVVTCGAFCRLTTGIARKHSNSSVFALASQGFPDELDTARVRWTVFPAGRSDPGRQTRQR